MTYCIRLSAQPSHELRFILPDLIELRTLHDSMQSAVSRTTERAQVICGTELAQEIISDMLAAIVG